MSDTKAQVYFEDGDWVLEIDGKEYPAWQHVGALAGWLAEKDDEIERLRAELSGKAGELEKWRQAAIWLSTRVSSEELAWACDTWPWLGEERWSMSDLPERLRELADAIQGLEWELPITARLDCVQAADEIERLRGLLATRDREECCEEVKEQYRAEIERLRAEVALLRSYADPLWKYDSGTTDTHNDVRAISHEFYDRAADVGI